MTYQRFSTAASLALLACAAFGSRTAAKQPIDSAYSAKIRELTPTDARWKFTTELVSSLPASATVPTPLKVLGYVPGTLGRLSYVADINKYFDALAAATPNRVKRFSLGKSEEGRESIVVAISDEANVANVEKTPTARGTVAAPSGLPSADRARIIKETQPTYWLSGSILSPETGSPEMLMELAYRLAVDESDFVKGIRANVITLITPVTEVDGRDRVVDVSKEARALKLGNNAVPLIYWGKYTAHDNNRDGMVMSQNLTRNFLRGFLYWHPTVVHDLHESVPFLYTSTGTGPYNDEYDPIVVDEWHTLAYQEITELTRRGLPGVWTHGFYDGWAPNYTLLAVANLHNSIGRFYETYTSSGAGCTTVRLQAADTSRRWDRPNPPVNGLRWCIRSNINYQQSGALIALKYTADHRETFLENFVAKGERMMERGRTSAPYAFVIPRDQRHAAEAADLVNLFRAQGTEVSVATSDFALKRATAKARTGSDSAAASKPSTDSAVLPWKVGSTSVSVAEEPFTIRGVKYAAGTYVINNPSDATRNAVKSLGLKAIAAGGAVSARQHSIRVPRIALMHSWLETQNEGWVRYAFDQMGVPYTYISDQSLRTPGRLDKFDVVVFPHVSGNPNALVNGRPMVGPPVPWKKSSLTPNLDLWDQTDDIRPGMGLEGAAALRRFVDRGGLLLTSGNSSLLPITLGFNPTVTQFTTTRLNARGSVIRVQPAPGASASPILYGYESPSFPIYFSQAPVFNVTPKDTVLAEGRDPAFAQQQERMRSRTILRFHEKADSLLVSGLLVGGDELAGKAAVVDAPVGSGHVVLFGIRPLWRWESQGSFALALNAIANWQHLGF